MRMRKLSKKLRVFRSCAASVLPVLKSEQKRVDPAMTVHFLYDTVHRPEWQSGVIVRYVVRDSFYFIGTV